MASAPSSSAQVWREPCAARRGHVPEDPIPSGPATAMSLPIRSGPATAIRPPPADPATALSTPFRP